MSKNLGKIIQIMGVVVDIEFEDGKLPASKIGRASCRERV